MDESLTADVVVVGSGSGGGVLAARLSEDPDLEVLVVEAGRDFPDEAVDPWPWMLHTGTGPTTPEHDWGYSAEPLANGRRIPLRRGRVVGGSSMTNGCVAVRGRPADFAAWERLGASGWGWDSMVPLYERVESELTIRIEERETWPPGQRLFAEGFEQLGFRWVDDLDHPESWDGVYGRWPHNVENGRRGGTLTTYLRRARPRPNLRIVDRTVADRVLVAGGRATGVRVVGVDGRQRTISADRVVLAAGSLGTPAILLRSGIGPAAELRAQGIEIVADLPVGRGMMDHPITSFRVAVPPEYAVHAGPVMPVVARGTDWWSIPITADDAGIMVATVCLATTDGAGTLRLRGTNPLAAPEIDMRFQGVIDRGAFDTALAHVADLVRTDALREVGARLLDAGPMREHLLARMGSGGHAAGGAAIGRVVDPDLAVLGVDGLHVADASVFPAHVTNNPNMTCFAIGERAAIGIAAALGTVAA